MYLFTVMPTNYKRKLGAAPRRQWTHENLMEALRRLETGEIGVNEAARTYGIPSRTLRRKRHAEISPNLPLGPQGILGIDNEKRLVRHVKKLQTAGFAPDRETLRTLCFQFAEKLGIRHHFNRETGMAGYDWLNSFLRRNKELSVRQSQGLSLARSEGMNREESIKFFNLLTECYTDYSMFTRPENIFNMDETGFQLNNEAGIVIASKGSKNVHTITSNEKGENISIIACCSAEGRYLPPVIILKGVREKKEFGDGLPAGSKVYMNAKSSYITSELFFKWLKEHFVPRKPPGKTILILDGHSSHRNSFEMLEYAEKNDVILICLPSHTTQALQPLDRSFFKSLKHHLKRETRQWTIHHPGRKLNRLQAGELIGKAWEKSASVETALSGFRATGIFPLNPNAVPDYFYSITDLTLSDNQNKSLQLHHLETSNSTDQRQSPIPGPSRILTEQNLEINGISPNKTHTESDEKETPSKFLNEISPVPIIQPSQRKRKKQSAEMLTLSTKQSKNFTNRNANNSNSDSDSDESTLAQIAKGLKKKKLERKQEKRVKKIQAKTDENRELVPNVDEERCVECLENYFKTTETVDWIQCTTCRNWYHETCSLYGAKCSNCGREERRADKAKIDLKKRM